MKLSVRVRRAFRFSLRTFLLLVALLGVWLALKVKRAQDQAAVVKMIFDRGGSVRYDFEPTPSEQLRRSDEQRAAIQSGRTPPQYVDEPWAPKWLRDLFGEDYFIPRELTNVNGTLVFAANSSRGMELW